MNEQKLNVRNLHKNSKVSVIITNWNGKQHLEECLDSLSKQTFKGFETILVDNGSSDRSVEFTEKNFPAVKIVRLDKNEGFCRGNNIGLQHARGDFIALLNNDTMVDIHWFEELISTYLMMIQNMSLKRYLKMVMQKWNMPCAWSVLIK